MAIIEDNANEDMKALKFCTDSILEEIDNTSEAIKKAVDTIIGGTNHQNELDGIVEQRVTEFQKMKNKITRLKGSVYPRSFKLERLYMPIHKPVAIKLLIIATEPVKTVILIV